MESRAPAQSRLLKLKQKLKESTKISSQSSANIASSGSSSKDRESSTSVNPKKSTILKLATAVKAFRAMKRPEKKNGDSSSASTSFHHGQTSREKLTERPKIPPRISLKFTEAEKKILSRCSFSLKDECSTEKKSASKIIKSSKLPSKSKCSNQEIGPELNSILSEKSLSSKESSASVDKESLHKKSMTKIQLRNTYKRKPPENLKNTIKHRSENSNCGSLPKLQNAFDSERTLKLKNLTANKKVLKDPVDSFSSKRKKLEKSSSREKDVASSKELALEAKIDSEIFTQANNSLQDCSMEWEPDKEEILRFARIDVQDDHEMMDWQEIITDNERFSLNDEWIGERTVYFVIDTNVLIRSISLIHKLLTYPDLRGFNAILMIPWQVLKELDKLKSMRDNYVASNARKATRFLSENVASNSRIVLQSQILHLQDCPQVLVEVPDDYLIKCCCQLKNHGKNVILLSNDVNLCVKCQAIGNLPAVDDKWLASLLENRNRNSDLHAFEKEPKLCSNSSGFDLSFFIHKLTVRLYDFLCSIIIDNYQKMFNIIWPLWLPDHKLTLVEVFEIFCSLPLPDICRKEFVNEVWSFFKNKKTYAQVTAIELDHFGRKCVFFSKTVNICSFESCEKFEFDMGFLKTGLLDSTDVKYIEASCNVGQNFFLKMEEEINSFINSLKTKLSSQNVCIPDKSTIMKKIDRYIALTNEASTIFLMLMDNQELSPRCPEVIIFYKHLLDFLGMVQTNSQQVPLVSAEDVCMFINHKRDQLIPEVLRWLSDVRRQLAEFKLSLSSI